MSSGDSRPLIGIRTTVPSRLIKSAVLLVHTSETLCPAINNFVLNNDPYEAPRMSTLYFIFLLTSSPPSDHFGTGLPGLLTTGRFPHVISVVVVLCVCCRWWIL